MTPAQCRAARGLLDWSQGRLAGEAGVSQSNISDFERSGRQIEGLHRVREALERAGVTLTEAGVEYHDKKRAN